MQTNKLLKYFTRTRDALLGMFDFLLHPFA